MEQHQIKILPSRSHFRRRTTAFHVRMGSMATKSWLLTSLASIRASRVTARVEHCDMWIQYDSLDDRSALAAKIMIHHSSWRGLFIVGSRPFSKDVKSGKYGISCLTRVCVCLRGYMYSTLWIIETTGMEQPFQIVKRFLDNNSYSAGRNVAISQ